MNKLRFAVGGMLLGTASCVSIPAIQQESQPLIGTLTSRHHTIHVYAGTEPQYTITDSAGKTLATMASPDDLRKAMPYLYFDLQRMLASDTVWAGSRSRDDLDLAGGVIEYANVTPIYSGHR